MVPKLHAIVSALWFDDFNILILHFHKEVVVLELIFFHGQKLSAKIREIQPLKITFAFVYK